MDRRGVAAPRSLVRRALATALAVAAMAAGSVAVSGPAAAASPGSIVFIKDHNVWVMSGTDPSTARPITTDGTADNAYTAPGQDDAGIVYAATADGFGDIVRMDHAGNRIGAPFRPPHALVKIDDIEPSPDGRVLAFTSLQGTTSPFGDGQLLVTAFFADFAWADGRDSSDIAHRLDGAYASWTAPDRVVFDPTFGTHFDVDGISTYRLGDPEPQPWLDTCRHSGQILDPFPDGCDNVSVPEVAAQADRLAASRDRADSLDEPAGVVVWNLAGRPPTGTTTQRCVWEAAPGVGSVNGSSWAPDGNSLVWDFTAAIDETSPPPGAGLYLATGFASGDCSGALAGARLVVPGGAQPDWSPAPLGGTGGGGGGGGGGGQPYGPFSDIGGSVHRDAIVAVAEADIASGYADGSFRPDLAVNRGQMATFLTRALDLPAGPTGAFPDVGTSVHAASIGAVAAAGITGGYPDGTFRPDVPVTRAQMATFLTRALGL